MVQFEVLLGNGGVVWARFLGRQRGSFLWWSASGILQASRAKGELFWWSAGELSFNLKFLNFQLYFTHTGLEVIDTCAALCSLARTFVILNAPLGFSCFLLDRTLEGGWFVVTSRQNWFHWARVLLEHNIQNGVFIHYFHDHSVWRCFFRECITKFQFLTELLKFSYGESCFCSIILQPYFGSWIAWDFWSLLWFQGALDRFRCKGISEWSVHSLFSQPLGLNVILPRGHNKIRIRDRIVEVSYGESCFWSMILQPNFGSDLTLLKFCFGLKVG